MPPLEYLGPGSVWNKHPAGWTVTRGRLSTMRHQNEAHCVPPVNLLRVQLLSRVKIGEISVVCPHKDRMSCSFQPVSEASGQLGIAETTPLWVWCLRHPPPPGIGDPDPGSQRLCTGKSSFNQVNASASGVQRKGSLVSESRSHTAVGTHEASLEIGESQKVLK